MTKSDTDPVWAIVPAAGVGRRVGGTTPKQYLTIHGKAILSWTVERLLQLEQLATVMVAVSETDEYWPSLSVSGHKKVKNTPGGRERCHSVLNAMQSLQGKAADHDWVLVHDAARPCVRVRDIERLLQACREADTGGILAMPVRDTMKQSDNRQRIHRTLDRSTMWHALTPQCFRYAELKEALETALDEGFEVTDEASAMEFFGQQPQLVEGHSDNIKVTLPQDVSLAAYFLQQQGAEA